MKIKLSEIDVVNTRKFDYEIQELDDIKLINPILVEVTIQKDKNEYVIFGRYSTKISSICVRCLSPLEIELKDKEFCGVAISEKDYQKYLDGLDKQGLMDDKNYIEIKDDELDIDDVVREQLILDMPQYPSCTPKCEDESYLEKYSGEETDSRWAGLMDIKIKN